MLSPAPQGKRGAGAFFKKSHEPRTFWTPRIADCGKQPLDKIL
jgi:hypothetical protein